ncbi:hypothetical protein DFP72DRAFT_423698 [Ephemerocybe angulata]|uniref:F-box domain-containing protein n=1 Tax=Ephemerocybe angulata TaxID=980116 RepID=A0A8H6IHD8_9AGAR|nr:hypothetical protein DFP72DRAFT_423698 [Tulosesus angulatus]
MALLSDLPVELFVKIMANLSAEQIFRMSQTCKTAHERVSQREVWKTALKEACDSNHLFKPTYPMESMDVPHLRRAALAIGRTARRSSGSQEIRAVHREDQATRTARGLRELGELKDVCIIPGGRYLVEVNSDCLRLWDLGTPWSSNDRIDTVKLISTRAGPKAFGCKFQSMGRSTPLRCGNNKFRFLALAQDATLGHLVLEVYEIGPLPEDNEIRLLASKEVGVWPGTHWRFWLDGDRVNAVLWVHSRVIVWDYVRNLHAFWCFHDQDLLEVTSIDDAVIAWTYIGVIVWNAPELVEMDASVSLVDQDPDSNHPPTVYATMQFPSWKVPPGASCEPSVMMSSTWYRPFISPLTFDMVAFYREIADDGRPRTHVSITRHRCNIPQKTMIQQGAPHVIRNFDTTKAKPSETPYHIPLADCTLAIFSEHNPMVPKGPFIVLSTPPLGDDSIREWNLETFVPPIDIGWMSRASICPASGLAAYVCAGSAGSAFQGALMRQELRILLVRENLTGVK